VQRGWDKEVGVLASILKIARNKEGRPLQVDEKRSSGSVTLNTSPRSKTWSASTML